MKKFIRSRTTVLMMVLVMMALSLLQPARGQTAAVKQAQVFSAAASANAALLRTYSWQMSVQATIKGEQKAASVYQLRFDPSGVLQKTLMTAPPPPPTGLTKSLKAKKIKEAKEWNEDLADLVKRYMAPSTGNMLDFYSKAKSETLSSGLVKESGKAFLQAGDSVAFFVDPTTKSPKQFTFSTSLQDDPVSGTITYGSTKDGLKYAAQIQIACPPKEVKVVVQTYNYIKQQ